MTCLLHWQEGNHLQSWNAYQQIPLDEQSKKIVAINTHKDLFQYNRLPFGISAFGVKHFHQYLLGSFIIKSDHKPLQYFLGDKKEIPSMAFARVKCWALTLSAYNYKV